MPTKKKSPKAKAPKSSAKGTKASKAKTSKAKAKPAPRPPKSEGRLVERAVFESKGHRIDKLPCARGYLVHPDHRWFDTLRAAKKWLREHHGAAKKGAASKGKSCGCSS